jgi:ATP-dependent DNA helicase RecQ
MPKRARPTLASTLGLLKNVFGLDAFPPGYEELIDSILGGRDTIGIMPPGVDTSLSYELPALLLPGTTIVVSANDTREELHDQTIDAGRMDGSSRREHTEDRNQIIAARKEILIITPEQLVSKELREALRQTDVALIVIDQTHGVSRSEHDLQPVYLENREAIGAPGRPPILALTEAGSPHAVRDVTAQLGLSSPHVVDARVYRPNLHFEVSRTSNEPQKRQHLVRLLQEVEGVGIVYASNVRQVDLLYDLLSGLGFKVAKYHGRMSPKQGKESQARFVNDEFHAMIATSAFGVDLDKINIRFVVHYNMPGTLEEYYQEAGRAGRDGRVARCALFQQVEERGTQLYFLGGRYPRVEDVQEMYDALMQLRAGAEPVAITELKAATPNLAESKVRAVLALLKDLGLVRERRGSKVELLRTDLGVGALEEMAAQHKNQHAADRGKLEQMMEYGQSARCRWKVLLEYFRQEVPWEQCGTCDNCLQPAEHQVKPAAERTEAADRVPPGVRAKSEQ